MQKIRNINSIHIFSIVTKTKNVTQAARLLNISQSSVSYHIKKLEADLSITLFIRTANGLQLTDDGALLAEYVNQGLGYIETGLKKVSDQASSVKIALLPMFSSRWLSSRLGSLIESNPDLQLSIHNHNNTFANMDSPEKFADLGIQWGRGNWKQFEVIKLWPEKLVAVCSPDYLKRNPIHYPSDIKNCTLLHVDDERMWDEWFTQNTLKIDSPQSKMMLQDRHFQLSSTINGLGVSLFASWLVENELKTGELIDPFKMEFDTTFAYHLIISKNALLSQSAKKFKHWMIQASKECST